MMGGGEGGRGEGQMRIWLDLLTPKQVLFFGPVIEELGREGAEVLATSRRYREVGPLAELAGLNLTYVGERGGRGPAEQLAAATRRQSEMIQLVQEFKPSVAVSVASAVCARVAYGLRIRHLAVNDSPHSEVAGRLSIPLSHRLLCPWVIPYKAWAPYGLRRDQVSTYRALDPAVWLKRTPIAGQAPELPKGKKTITIRVQESDAPYMANAGSYWIDDVIVSMMDAFPDSNIVVLCRYDYQVEEFREKYGSRCIVPKSVVSGRTLLLRTDLFVGMGGTMSAEAALMGVPTISTFQGSLYTDRYLEKTRILARARTPGRLASLARRFFSDTYKASQAERARKVLASMEDPVPRIVALIKATAKQA